MTTCRVLWCAYADPDTLFCPSSCARKVPFNSCLTRTADEQDSGHLSTRLHALADDITNFRHLCPPLKSLFYITWTFIFQHFIIMNNFYCFYLVQGDEFIFIKMFHLKIEKLSMISVKFYIVHPSTHPDISVAEAILRTHVTHLRALELTWRCFLEQSRVDRSVLESMWVERVERITRSREIIA